MFCLAIADRRQSIEGFRFFAGRLVLGESIEFLRCASGYWSPRQYRSQWRVAAARLASHPMATSAFVTSAAKGPGNFEWWLARRRGNTVTFTNQLVFLGRPRLHVSAELAHEQKHRPTYRGGHQEQRPSEWRLPFSEIRRYMRHEMTSNPSVKRASRKRAAPYVER
ncbi:hypothetical protein [Roseateles sp. BYS96W]|uniref:CdiI C-terminal domain-containing protein n=1 Tax=Pelomonas nitida TaxID=3299027 RepID=A0ABW7GBC6_9BURK